MMRVRNSKEYREAHAWIRLLEEALERNGFGKPEGIRKEIADQKREMRRWANRSSAIDVGMGFKVERRIVKNDFESGIVLESIPEVFDDEESATEFFEDFLKMEYQWGPYDCTGQIFTTWYKIFKRNGQYWAYHAQAMDV